jgi:predicted amidophosphoribosyltransferase
VRELWEGLRDLLLPRACAGCGAALGPQADAPLCGRCAAGLERIPPGGCPLCQAPAPGSGPCPTCAAARGPLAACAAEVWFAGEAARWMHRFKYPGGELAALDPRADAVAESWIRAAARRLPGPPPDLWLPVPPHVGRLRERGFSPPLVLARAAARALGGRVDSRSLLAARATASQTGLSRAGRRRNVAGAFRVAPRFGRGARLALVDDVVTTGSTLAEAARALRSAGAECVVAVCAARTPAAG